MGGIVIKKVILSPMETQALLTDGDQTLAVAREGNNYKNIFESTRGIMFMGTPHTGADVAKLASTIANIARTLNTINMNNLNLLQPGSEPLIEVSRNFGHLVQNLKVVTVVESQKTPIPYSTMSIQASNSFHPRVRKL